MGSGARQTAHLRGFFSTLTFGCIGGVRAGVRSVGGEALRRLGSNRNRRCGRRAFCQRHNPGSRITGSAVVGIWHKTHCTFPSCSRRNAALASERRHLLRHRHEQRSWHLQPAASRHPIPRGFELHASGSIPPEDQHRPVHPVGRRHRSTLTRYPYPRGVLIPLGQDRQAHWGQSSFSGPPAAHLHCPRRDD